MTSRVGRVIGRPAPGVEDPGGVQSASASPDRAVGGDVASCLGGAIRLECHRLGNRDGVRDSYEAVARVVSELT
ncbi:hypothetical protein [Nonomuraea sp. NPDC049400]|uniref:hypothetical protein n=1 Tax=Nonomuraea sp. NPDC049400 TaxID=3364352 RepID=UPI0037AB784C